MPARSDKVALVGIATAVAVADQLTKFSLVSTIGPGRLESRVEVVDGWLALEYTENRGAAFGLLSGLVPALAAASIAIVAGLLLHSWQARPQLWHTLGCREQSLAAHWATSSTGSGSDTSLISCLSGRGRISMLLTVQSRLAY